MPSRLSLFLALAALCSAQPSTHKEITLDSQTLDRYVGAYQMENGANMLIMMESGQVVSKLGNQPPLPVFAESQTSFFAKAVNAQLEFAKLDDKGKPAELILHQNGRDMPMKRLDDATAKKLFDAVADFNKRFKDQTAAAGGEAALRKMVESIAAGKPNYDLMSPGLANVTRQQLTGLQSEMTKSGALQSIKFKGVGPGGADIYLVSFEKGALEYRIWMGIDGKVDSANFRPGALEASAGSVQPHVAEIDSLIASELAKRPVGSVTAGIVAGKDLAWTKSYGDADMEKKIPADKDTVYRIGSITKMFTAVMLEQLAASGKVHLSDAAEKYFPEINQVKDRFPGGPPATLMQLATHTSGLGREPDNTDTYVTGKVADWEKTLISALPQTHWQFEPGTRFSYSNIGYAILGVALSRASGESYIDYVTKHIFQPLGMTHSAFDRTPEMMPHLSKGYLLTSPTQVDSEMAQKEHETGRGYKVPNGAIYTTVGDLAKFVSFLLGQGPASVLAPAALDRFQAQMIVPADIGLTQGYGIGFEVQRRDNYVAFGHGGAVAGYTADLLMSRKGQVGVVVFSNGAANPATIAGKMLDILSK